MNVSQRYSQNETVALDEKGLEVRALIKTASALNNIKENWEANKSDLEEALDKNRLLWTVIASAMREDDCPQPESVRSNILNLALFVFQRTISVLADPQPTSLDVLININMNIAKGLGEDSSKGAK